MTQLSGGSGGDTFWPDMAATVLRNMLSLARAYSCTEPGKAAARRTQAHQSLRGTAIAAR